MSFLNSFNNSLRKLRGYLGRSRWRKKIPSPFHGGLKAAWTAWRERRRKLPPDDISHSFTARAYPGSRARLYVVHAPGGRVSDKPKPLVVVLHGCQQTNHDIEQISGFNEVSDENGFLVVYPFITSYRGMRNRNCWGWWFDREIHAGAGEVEDLWQIIEEVKQNYAVDEHRIHVAGLSSGAGMAVAMLVAHSSRIASGAAVAGVPYGEKADSVAHALNPVPSHRPVIAIATEMAREMGEDARTVPIQIVHSRDDDKVLLKSAENLRDSWGHHFEIDLHQPHTQQGQVAGTDWEHNKYQDREGRTVLETLFLEGPGHGWYGGNPGRFSFPDAPDVSAHLWEFFEAHPLQ